MEIKKIDYLHAPEDVMNDCLDVFVTLEDDYCTDGSFYFVEVMTLQFLSSLMEKNKSDFISPAYPCIVVSKLTHDIIEAAIQAFIDTEEDSYWLKLYHIPAILEIEEINEILKKKKEENIRINAKIDAKIEAEMRAEGLEKD